MDRFKTMKALMLGCIDGAQEGDITSVLGAHHIPS